MRNHTACLELDWFYWYLTGFNTLKVLREEKAQKLQQWTQESSSTQTHFQSFFSVFIR